MFGHFTIRSRLPCPPETVWADALSRRGINDEFFPWLRMRLPAGELPARLDGPTRLGRCWMLLFGCLPVECDDLTLLRLEPGVFDERSRMLGQRVWWHRRRVTAVAGGCEVVDRVAFLPRWRAMLPLCRPLFRLVFAWRHRRLRRRYR
ncbi:hypothetical protein CXB49_14415 [Chromobacterium sp. ATCC 53434]|uniref:hypothetical protein n=1 Tax=Chromobacterium sp. (strain ATCC 53434 / SC 14030) TaxID=2059672 RepID=UPI000C785851|nr:hypothetical protein [Chromobacterium sp. ATCC 53434]AUH51929.1 hypothetical protein CXB49_14415 [Chromobacterium sp. ATCC 53434]